jgi:nucleoside-diphosphate-sugar epimerase
MSPPRRVLITGIDGFIGGHLARALLDAGVQVRGLSRRVRAEERLDGIEIVVASGLDDHEALRRAVQGVDAIVHLAGRVHVMRDTVTDALGEFRRVNVDGTRALAEAARNANVEKFVLVSSVKAIGEGADRPWTEETPPRPKDPYGISKLEAEKVLQALAASSDMAAIVLRFPLVYGPGMKANMLRLFRLVAAGVPLPFKGIANRRSLLFSGNAVSAIEVAIRSEAANFKSFLVSDGQDVSTPELIQKIAMALGKPVRLFRIPEGAFRLVGRAGDLISPAVRAPISEATIDRLFGSLAVDSSEIRRSLSFSPPYTVEAGLAITARWFETIYAD